MLKRDFLTSLGRKSVERWSLPARIWLAVILALPLALSACSSPKIKDTCLPGTWLLASEEMFARATIPAGAFEPKTLNFEKAAGFLMYEFSKDGVVSIAADGWASRFGVRVEATLYVLDVQIQGLARGQYSLEGGTIKLDEVDLNEIQYVATLDEEEMMNSQFVREFAPLFVAAYMPVKFACTGDTLSLSFEKIPGVDQPITFVRVKSTPAP